MQADHFAPDARQRTVDVGRQACPDLGAHPLHQHTISLRHLCPAAGPLPRTLTAATGPVEVRPSAPSYGQGVDIDLDEITRRRQQIARDHLHRDRPPSSARGLHHTALVSSDVERTVRFYQDVLGFPLTEVMENRDYAGSTHFFFDIGNGNALAFFDFPGLDVGPYAEVLGGLHHIAISIERPQWEAARARLTDAGVEVIEESGVSLYFRDPDGARLELLAEPLGQMYGERVV